VADRPHVADRPPSTATDGPIDEAGVVGDEEDDAGDDFVCGRWTARGCQRGLLIEDLRPPTFRHHRGGRISRTTLLARNPSIRGGHADCRIAGDMKRALNTSSAADQDFALSDANMPADQAAVPERRRPERPAGKNGQTRVRHADTAHQERCGRPRFRPVLGGRGTSCPSCSFTHSRSEDQGDSRERSGGKGLPSGFRSLILVGPWRRD